MLKPETSVQHLDAAYRMVAAVLELPGRLDRAELLTSALASIKAVTHADDPAEDAAISELDTALAAVAARGWTVGLSGPYQHGGWHAYITAWNLTRDIYGAELRWQTTSDTGRSDTPVAAVQNAMRAAERMGAEYRDPTITEDLDAEAYKREEAMGGEGGGGVSGRVCGSGVMEKSE